MEDELINKSKKKKKKTEAEIFVKKIDIKKTKPIKKKKYAQLSKR
jgi:hypothetical protein